jgi:hypothetical protein
MMTSPDSRSDAMDRAAAKRYVSIAFLIVAPFIAGIALFYSSCKDTITDTGSPTVVFPSSNVSYNQHVETLWAQACAYGGCHSGASPAKGLDLQRGTSYWSLMNHVPQLVIQHDGQNSLLMMYLDGRIGIPMPPVNRPPLTQNQITGVKRWIDEGGQNN